MHVPGLTLFCSGRGVPPDGHGLVVHNGLGMCRWHGKLDNNGLRAVRRLGLRGDRRWRRNWLFANCPVVSFRPPRLPLG